MQNEMAFNAIIKHLKQLPELPDKSLARGCVLLLKSILDEMECEGALSERQKLVATVTIDEVSGKVATTPKQQLPKEARRSSRGGETVRRIEGFDLGGTISPETQAALDAIDANVRHAAQAAPSILVGDAPKLPVTYVGPGYMKRVENPWFAQFEGMKPKGT